MRTVRYFLRGFLPGILLLSAGVATVAAAPAGAACAPSVPIDEPVARASRHFGVPHALIRAVIAVESGGAVFAISPKGAMGLMQLMPATWATLRLRYALGPDPFDPCDNVFAGTAYLRELLDRYGDPGFLAAYNAGPGRYESYRAGARPLPAETVAYVARISGRMIGGGGPNYAAQQPDPDAWRRGGLFAGASLDRPIEASTRDGGAPLSDPTATSSEPVSPPRDSLFVPRTTAGK